MARNITRLLIIVIYTGLLSFYLGQIVEVFLFAYNFIPVLDGIGIYTIQFVRDIGLLTSVVAYVAGLLWSNSQIAKATYLTDYQKIISKKMLLTKPFTGIAINYLMSSMSRTTALFLDKRIIGILYYGRVTSVLLLFLGIGILFVAPTVLCFVALAALIPLVLLMHILFEISILLTILEKGDQEIGIEEHYFNAIQSPFEYSKYYRNKLANKGLV